MNLPLEIAWTDVSSFKNVVFVNVRSEREGVEMRIEEISVPSDQVRPLVSVIIPCFNQARFLGEALEGVLRQTYKNIEIVVVDDGSSDNTAEVASAYPAVRLIRQKNQGVSTARNIGVRKSQGEYLVFLDADDCLRPQAIEINMGYMQAHPECGGVAGRVIKVDSDGVPVPMKQLPRVEKAYYPDLLADDRTGAPAAAMFRRSIFESVGGFDTSLKSAEDFDLYLRITRQAPILYHDTIIAEYRKYETSKSANRAFKYKHMMAIFRSQRKYVKGNKRYAEAYRAGLELRQKFYVGKIVRQVRDAVHHRQWKRAAEGILVLSRYDPAECLKQMRRKLYNTACKLQSRTKITALR